MLDDNKKLKLKNNKIKIVYCAEKPTKITLMEDLNLLKDNKIFDLLIKFLTEVKPHTNGVFLKFKKMKAEINESMIQEVIDLFKLNGDFIGSVKGTKI